MAKSDQDLVDELMPNAGDVIAPGVSVPDEPTDDIEAEDHEEAAVMGTAAPIIEELLAWFDEQIAGCDSVEQVRITLASYNKELAKGKPNATVDDVLVGHDVVRTLLDTKREDLRSRAEAFANRGNNDEPAA